MARITEKQEYPKGSGITIRPVSNITKGVAYGVSFEVLLPAKVTGGKRLRKRFPNVAEAKRYADKMLRGYRKDGESFFKLTDGERKEIGLMVPRLREKGISITEAVEYALSRLRPVGGEKTLSEVVSELQASKLKRHEVGDLAHHSLRDFNNRSTRLSDDLGGRMVHDITSHEIKDWIQGFEVSNRTKMNYLRIASEVFRYARQRRYITENPIDELGDTDRKEMHGRLIHSGEIKILSVKQAEDLLHFTHTHYPDYLPVITLGLFCGIRTEELQKLEWSKVNIEGGYVTIDSAIAKKRRIRHVTLPDCAKQWLLTVQERKGNIAPCRGSNFEKGFYDVRMAAGFKDKQGKSTWPINGMRHSFGSYHYALYGDSMKTSKEIGHKGGDDVLFDHYRALASKEQGEAYFKIVPGESGERVLEFKEAQA